MESKDGKKKIILTGGGTAGHVTPNIALLPELSRRGFDVTYIGSHEGIESRLIADFDIPYQGIQTGKLRRYFDLRNLTDPARVLIGYREAKRLLRQIDPAVVFSKGGFVGVPVVRAAASLGIPCIIHESDMTPGLANRICIPVAQKVCCNFPETVRMITGGKAVLTGSPIREELRHGDKAAALKLCGFNENQPLIMVMGGSLGAVSINQTLQAALPQLLEDFQIIHVCGKGNIYEPLAHVRGYKQFDYVKSELKDLLAAADLVVSRAGANSICELLALRKPNLLIPLDAGSRGDQIMNARSFEAQGFSLVIKDGELSAQLLVDKILELYFSRLNYIEAMDKSDQTESIVKIVDLIEEVI